MIVVVNIGIVSAHFPDPDQVDLPHLLENFEISVNRSETEPGESLPDNIVQLVCGRMSPGFFQFLQDNPTLFGHPVFLFFSHN